MPINDHNSSQTPKKNSRAKNERLYQIINQLNPIKRVESLEYQEAAARKYAETRKRHRRETGCGTEEKETPDGSDPSGLFIFRDDYLREIVIPNPVVQRFERIETFLREYSEFSFACVREDGVALPFSDAIVSDQYHTLSIQTVDRLHCGLCWDLSQHVIQRVIDDADLAIRASEWMILCRVNGKAIVHVMPVLEVSSGHFVQIELVTDSTPVGYYSQQPMELLYKFLRGSLYYKYVLSDIKIEIYEIPFGRPSGLTFSECLDWILTHPMTKRIFPVTDTYRSKEWSAQMFHRGATSVRKILYAYRDQYMLDL